MTVERRWMTDDKAGQVQSGLSAGGTKRDIENTPKCTHPNCILPRRSSLGTPPAGGHRTNFGQNQSIFIIFCLHNQVKPLSSIKKLIQHLILVIKCKCKWQRQSVSVYHIHICLSFALDVSCKQRDKFRYIIYIQILYHLFVVITLIHLIVLILCLCHVPSL